MRLRALALLMTTLALVPGIARAQDFGVMESAETIDRGTFKLKVNPILVFGKNDADNEGGVGIAAGYGVTDRFDVEGMVSFFDGAKFFGGNVEYWLARDAEQQFDLSIGGGVHFGRGDLLLDTTGVDLTFIASKHVQPRLELYGALDFAFESITDDFVDGSYKTIHLVPGIEYKLGEDLDFVAEIGLALNDDANHYISGGIAYYFR